MGTELYWFFFCSELFVPELNGLFSNLHLFITSRCMWDSCDEKCCFIFSLIPPHLLLHAADFLISHSFFIWPLLVWLLLTENMLQLCGCLRVLPGWYIAVVHVGCHHHSSSSSVALETQQQSNEDLIFQARMTFQHLNHSEFTFLQCYYHCTATYKQKLKLLLHDQN